jgi:hypothetical protein
MSGQALDDLPGPKANQSTTDSMQLADELPMIYTVCIMSYIAFSYGKAPKVKAFIAVALAGVACFITVGT